jgi:hypothetical protein
MVKQHKADFIFNYQANGEISIIISLPNASEPFFSATVTPSKLLPSFPLKTKWIPISLDLLQPPLPQIDEFATSTEDWQKTPFDISQPNARIAYIKPSLKDGQSYSNGADFPNVTPFSAGLYCKDAVVDFNVPFTPHVVGLADTPNDTVSKRD